MARARVARGESFEVRGRIQGVIPEQAVIEYEGISPSLQTCLIKRKKDGTEGVVGILVARLERVEHNFRFQVRANDAASDWQAVEVLPPPVLAPLNGRPSPQVRLTYPA